MTMRLLFYSCFFFNDTATTEIYPLSLHDALPISKAVDDAKKNMFTVAKHGQTITHESLGQFGAARVLLRPASDRKSTRLNSSHVRISYAVFCLKKTTYFSVWQTEHSRKRSRLPLA